MTGPDAYRMYDVLDLIKKHQAQLDMNIWAYRLGGRLGITLADITDDFESCGTVACLAGWTDLAAGYRITSADGHGWAELIHPVPGPHPISGTVPGVAAALLRLSPGDAEELFYHTDDDEIEERILEFFGPDPRSVSGQLSVEKVLVGG